MKEMTPAEVDTAAPLAASFAVGAPARIAYRPSFVDGIGSPFVLEEMWPRVRALLDGSLVSPVAEVAAAVRVLMERSRVVAEGAGALSLAAALTGQAGPGPIVAIVSGGNVDLDRFCELVRVDPG